MKGQRQGIRISGEIWKYWKIDSKIYKDGCRESSNPPLLVFAHLRVVFLLPAVYQVAKLAVRSRFSSGAAAAAAASVDAAASSPAAPLTGSRCLAICAKASSTYGGV